MTLLVTDSLKKLDLSDEIEALETLNELATNWDWIRAQVPDIEGASDIFDLLTSLDDRLELIEEQLEALGISLDLTRDLSKKLKERYGLSVPEPLRKLLEPVRKYYDRNGLQDAGLASWQFLNAGKSLEDTLGHDSIGVTISGEANSKMVFEAGDNLPLGEITNGRFYRYGFGGQAKIGGALDVPFAFGSANFSAGVGADLDLNYWYNIYQDDLGDLLALMAIKHIDDLPNPFDLDDIWNEAQKGDLAAIKVVVGIEHESAIAMKFNRHETIVGSALEAGFEFAASIKSDRAFDLYIDTGELPQTPEPGDDSALVLHLKRKALTRTMESAALTIGVDLDGLVSQVRAYIDPAVSAYEKLKDEYEEFLTPGKYLRDHLSEEVRELIDANLANSTGLRAAALSLTGQGEDTLVEDLSNKVYKEFDSGIGVLNSSADQVANGIISKVNQVLPTQLAEPAEEKLSEIVTILVSKIETKLKEKVDGLFTEYSDKYEGIKSELGQFIDTNKQKVEDQANQADQTLAEVRTFINTVDNRIQNLTESLEKAAKAKLKIRAYNDESLERTSGADLVVRITEVNDQTRRAFKEITRGDFTAIETLLSNNPEGLEFQEGLVEYFIGRHKSEGVEIGLIGIGSAVGATEILDSSVRVKVDLEGNLVIDSDTEFSRGLKSAREHQEVKFMSPYDLIVARETKHFSAKLTVSQEDKRMQEHELQNFLAPFLRLRMVSQESVSGAINQLAAWRTNDRKDVSARVDLCLSLDAQALDALLDPSLADVTADEQYEADAELFEIVSQSLVEAGVYEDQSSIDDAASAVRSIAKKIRRKFKPTEAVFLGLQPSLDKEINRRLRQRFETSEFGHTHTEKGLRYNYDFSKSPTQSARRFQDIHFFAKGFAVLGQNMADIYNLNPETEGFENGSQITEYLDLRNQMILLCLSTWLKPGRKFLWIPSDDTKDTTVAFFLLISKISGLLRRSSETGASVLSIQLSLLEDEEPTIKNF